MYRFIRGKPCGHLDLVSPPIWRGVARRLAQWHAALPSSGAAPIKESPLDVEQDADITVIQPRRAGPSIWAVLQKWVLALPVTTPEQRARRLSLQAELQWVVEALDDGKGIGEDGVCFFFFFFPRLLFGQHEKWDIKLLTVIFTARFLTL